MVKNVGTGEENTSVSVPSVPAQLKLSALKQGHLNGRTTLMQRVVYQSFLAWYELILYAELI